MRLGVCLCLNAGRQTSWWLFCPREINSGASVLLLSVSGIWNRNIIISLHPFSLFLSEKKAAKRNKKWPRGCLPANKARDTFEPPHSSSFSLSALYYFFFQYFFVVGLFVHTKLLLAVLFGRFWPPPVMTWPQRQRRRPHRQQVHARAATLSVTNVGRRWCIAR